MGKEGKGGGGKERGVICLRYQIRKVASRCHSRTYKISPREKQTTRLDINLVKLFPMIRTILSRRQKHASSSSSSRLPHTIYPTCQTAPCMQSQTPSLDGAKKIHEKETTSQDENKHTCPTFSSLQSPVLSSSQDQNSRKFPHESLTFQRP